MSNQQNVTTLAEYKPFTLPAPMDASFDAADVAEDLEGLELSFPRVKIPGGGVPQFKMPGEDPDHPTYVGEIEGIILYNHSANACWPEGSEYEDNTPPQCQSMDGIQGYGNPGLLCEACGNNQFGSSGKGKLCKNMRMLYILQDGVYMPLQLALPPTSIKPYKNFVNMAFALRNRPVYGSLVRITLKPVSSNGFDYSVPAFNRVRGFTGRNWRASGHMPRISGGSSRKCRSGRPRNSRQRILLCRRMPPTCRICRTMTSTFLWGSWTVSVSPCSPESDL